MDMQNEVDEKRLYFIGKCMVILSVCILIMIGICHFFFIFSYVPTDSMEPTISKGGRTVGYKFCHKYKKGDVILFENNQQEKCVKRIIGTGGDCIEIKDGRLYINQKMITETYILDDSSNGTDGKWTVPKDCFFVMGDNRKTSRDSRQWTQPFIKKKDIAAVCIFMI